MVGTASVMDEQSAGAEHVTLEQVPEGAAAQAVVSQHGTDDEQTMVLVDDEAAPQVGSVQVLAM